MALPQEVDAKKLPAHVRNPWLQTSRRRKNGHRGGPLPSTRTRKFESVKTKLDQRRRKIS